MKGVTAIYLGRIIDKSNFRTFIYSPDGTQKLVDSWDDYEKHIETGLWFALKEDAITRISIKKPKRSKKSNVVKDKEEVVSESVNDTPDLNNEMSFEAKKEDDFLPKDASK